jgi:hypothetical protein
LWLVADVCIRGVAVLTDARAAPQL